ncbi:MAG: hypothetical protein AB7H88_01965 [Vicinamibacterales bacterium]
MQASQVVVVAAALSIGFVLPALVSHHADEAAWNAPAAPETFAAPVPDQPEYAPAFQQAAHEIQVAASEEAVRDGAGAVVVTGEDGRDMSLITFEGQVLLPRQ